jgi:hypothetical protein
LLGIAVFLIVLGSLFAVGFLGARWPWPALGGLLCSLGLLGVAVLILFTACELVYRATVLTVRGSQLMADYGRVWGVPLRREWARERIAAIRTESNRHDEAIAIKVYLRPNPSAFAPFLTEWTLARYRDPAELRWVATALRQVLDVPAVEPPPPGPDEG